MDYEQFSEGTIRGERRGLKVTVKRRNTPGFAPTHYTVKVCDLVTRFPYGEDSHYAQFFDFSGCLSLEELEELVARLKALKENIVVEEPHQQEEDEFA